MLLSQNVECEDEHCCFQVKVNVYSDTCFVGKDVSIVNTAERVASVTLYLKVLGSVTKVPLVTAAIGYDDANNGDTFVLLVHISQYFK
jgi:Na+/phosphate symporter